MVANSLKQRLRHLQGWPVWHLEKCLVVLPAHCVMDACALEDFTIIITLLFAKRHIYFIIDLVALA